MAVAERQLGDIQYVECIFGDDVGADDAEVRHAAFDIGRDIRPFGEDEFYIDEVYDKAMPKALLLYSPPLRSG